MNCPFFLRLAASRTRSSACVTRTRLWVRCVLCWSAFPVVPGLGSAGSLASRPALFVGFVATHMGVFGSSGQVHRHIKKLRWLFRYPRSEPYFMTWLVPHQIKLTSGRRSKQLHQYPAFGGWGSGGRDHSFTRLFKPVHGSVPIAWIRQDRLGPGD